MISLPCIHEDEIVTASSQALWNPYIVYIYGSIGFGPPHILSIFIMVYIFKFEFEFLKSSESSFFILILEKSLFLKFIF